MNNRLSYKTGSTLRQHSLPLTQSGVGLIEVMVAVLILAVGLLGIAALQATALRNSQSSLERSQAVINTYSILDAMRANRDVARIGGYDLLQMTCNPPNKGSLAADDLHKWITDLQSAMGAAACGQIVCGNLSCKITVQWDGSRGTGGIETETLVTETRI